MHMVGLLSKPLRRSAAHLSGSGNILVLGGNSGTKEQNPGDVALHRSGRVHHKQGDIGFLLLTNYCRHQHRGGEVVVSQTSVLPLCHCLWAAGEVAPGMREHMAEDTDYLMVREQREGERLDSY